MAVFRSSALVAAFVMLSSAALAQGWQSQTVPASTAKPKSTASPPVRPAAAKTEPRQLAASQPLQAQIQYLVRTTLLALNDANRTGNYTVLRDLAAPSFREKNSAADLALVFAEMRRARLDLSMAAIMAPDLDEQPTLDGERRLRLKGNYPTEPNRVVFDLIYEAVGGQWLLNGVSISTRPARTAAGGPVPGR